MAKHQCAASLSLLFHLVSTLVINPMIDDTLWMKMKNLAMKYQYLCCAMNQRSDCLLAE